MTELCVNQMDSPVGSLMLVWRDAALCALGFDDREQRVAASLKVRFGPVKLSRADDHPGFRSQLSDYFAGDLDVLEQIPVDTGGTEFQQNVWRMLRTIRAGKTATYGELASKLGSPNAARAVGLANGSNPVAIVVPCHRVIGSAGKLVGYGGGLDRKRWLLTHERAMLF